mgnify:FL=1
MFTRSFYLPIVLAFILMFAGTVSVDAQTGATTTEPAPPPAPTTAPPPALTPELNPPPQGDVPMGMRQPECPRDPCVDYGKGELDLDLGPSLEEVKEAEKEGRAGGYNIDGSEPKTGAESKAKAAGEAKPAEPDSEIFNDGFESGDQNKWSSEDGR